MRRPALRVCPWSLFSKHKTSARFRQKHGGWDPYWSWGSRESRAGFLTVGLTLCGQGGPAAFLLNEVLFLYSFPTNIPPLCPLSAKLRAQSLSTFLPCSRTVAPLPFSFFCSNFLIVNSQPWVCFLGPLVQIQLEPSSPHNQPRCAIAPSKRQPPGSSSQPVWLLLYLQSPLPYPNKTWKRKKGAKRNTNAHRAGPGATQLQALPLLLSLALSAESPRPALADHTHLVGKPIGRKQE